VSRGAAIVDEFRKVLATTPTTSPSAIFSQQHLLLRLAITMSHENMYICESQMMEKYSDSAVRKVEKQRRKPRAPPRTETVTVEKGVVRRVTRPVAAASSSSRDDGPMVSIAEGAELLDGLSAEDRRELLLNGSSSSHAPTTTEATDNHRSSRSSSSSAAAPPWARGKRRPAPLMVSSRATKRRVAHGSDQLEQTAADERISFAEASTDEEGG
jgi:hypothetical protein